MTRVAETLNRYTVRSRWLKITDPQAVGEELARLAGNAALRGLTAQAVVMAAKPKKSPLHQYVYRESDSTAAFQWRCHRARQLLDSIVYVEPRSGTAQRAITYVREGEIRGYVKTDSVLSNAALVESKQREALDALRRWLAAYALFAIDGSELETIVKVVRKALSQ